MVMMSMDINKSGGDIQSLCINNLFGRRCRDTVRDLNNFSLRYGYIHHVINVVFNINHMASRDQKVVSLSSYCLWHNDEKDAKDDKETKNERMIKLPSVF